MAMIRGKAIVVFEHKGKFLFTVCHEQEKNEVFYIPVGGGIEFGEHSMDAARREVLEETGMEIADERLLNTTENIFTFNGKEEHEIVFTYSARFRDPAAYSNELRGNLNAEGNPIKLIWTTLEEIREKNIQLYPLRLMEILEKEFTLRESRSYQPGLQKSL